MRKPYRWCTRFLICLAGSISGVWAQEANLVVNGGLEDASAKHTDRPTGFEPRNIGREPAAMTWESPGYRGRRCIAVESSGSGGFGYWQTMVSVRPETTYTVSLYYKTQAEEPRAATGDPLYNQGRAGGPNVELGMVPGDPEQAGKPTSWSDIGIALPPVGGLYLPVAAEWSRFQHTFVTRPGQTKLLLKLRVRCYAQKAWFDEISVTEGASPEKRGERDPLWTPKDTTPPAVFRPDPPPNTNVEANTRISVLFAERPQPVRSTAASRLAAPAELAIHRPSLPTNLRQSTHPFTQSAAEAPRSMA